jgi:hypothetical protein
MGKGRAGNKVTIINNMPLFSNPCNNLKKTCSPTSSSASSDSFDLPV